jgi:hypothetical protein
MHLRKSGLLLFVLLGIFLAHGCGGESGATDEEVAASADQTFFEDCAGKASSDDLATDVLNAYQPTEVRVAVGRDDSSGSCLVYVAAGFLVQRFVEGYADGTGRIYGQLDPLSIEQVDPSVVWNASVSESGAISLD